MGGIRYLGMTAGGGYAATLEIAREDVNKILESQDRSSYLLAQYMPEPTRDAFLAIRAFNLEINKIAPKQSSGPSPLGVSAVDLKFKFWSDLLTRIFTNPDSDTNIGEPIAFLLRDALRNNLNLELSCLHQFLQSRRHFLNSSGFNSTDDICAYGEGTYSQLNYLTQGLLLSPGISPSAISLLEHSRRLQGLVSDVAAHIGQATAVASMVLGSKYYASKNSVTVPVDVMTRHDVSQEQFLRLAQGHDQDMAATRQSLQNCFYDVAVVANDHILTARQKLQEIREETAKVVKSNPNDKLLQKNHRKWRHGIPDVIFLPFMVSIPTTLYLRRLEKNDFDIFAPAMDAKEWRLAWTSFRGYYQRRI
ncbi:hypothetical protein CANTEDRAFT_112535 [Yamadazyma tenuis ATCC 10573]|uniref:Terpenoid synthase n=2 Tax=Candida tenuis TaxID=2315449 RepID=G3AXP5_CANTC|nr:uncharacterized protein CANTEDRAFT_112535 [Yamadazyma tenuis ATCC 10573]EGV65666.1 hypothetical protein CANTEDRAFT_112535 [Yamadazyma tenuis ATCC 10573]